MRINEAFGLYRTAVRGLGHEPAEEAACLLAFITDLIDSDGMATKRDKIIDQMLE